MLTLQNVKFEMSECHSTATQPQNFFTTTILNTKVKLLNQTIVVSPMQNIKDLLHLQDYTYLQLQRI